MQAFGKRVCGIHDEAYALIATEAYHCLLIHSTCKALAVYQWHFLLIASCTVEIWLASLFQHIHGPAAFCRSSEDDNHLSKQ